MIREAKRHAAATLASLASMLANVAPARPAWLSGRGRGGRGARISRYAGQLGALGRKNVFVIWQTNKPPTNKQSNFSRRGHAGQFSGAPGEVYQTRINLSAQI